MKRTKFILSVLLIAISLSLFASNVDTEKLFETDRVTYRESNDCTVRAYSVVTGLTYQESRGIINNSVGRKTGKGISGINFARFIIKTHRDRLVTAYNYLESRGRTAPQKDFIETRCKEGNIYVVFTNEHVFVIKYFEGKWTAFGNRGDNERDIAAYIELKQ